MSGEDSLKHILDFNRLMDGENRKSDDPEDVQHWRAVYSDLIGFKEKMLSDTHRHIAEAPATESELGKNDVPFLRAEMERLKRGFEFWDGRSKKIK